MKHLTEFWRKIFGREVPVSGDRAHLGNVTIAYRPDAKTAGFDTLWSTDAKRVYVIDGLWIFDYGDKPIEVFVPGHLPYTVTFANSQSGEHTIKSGEQMVKIKA